MSEQARLEQFDLAAGAFYVLGTLALLGGLGGGLGLVILHFAEPRSDMQPWPLWIPLAAIAAGVGLILLGVALAKRWRYVGFFLAVIVLPLLANFPWGSGGGGGDLCLDVEGAGNAVSVWPVGEVTGRRERT